MAPSKPMSDEPNHLASDAEFFRNFSVSVFSINILLSNLSNLVRTKLGHAVPFSNHSSAFLGHVASVVIQRPFEKVGWPNAFGIVTSMANAHTMAYFSVRQLIGNSVGAHINPIKAKLRPFYLSSAPHPAIAIFNNMTPESIYVFFLSWYHECRYRLLGTLVSTC